MTAGIELSNGPTAGILSSHHVVVSAASGESGPSVMATMWTPKSARACAVVTEWRRYRAKSKTTAVSSGDALLSSRPVECSVTR